MAAPRQGLPVRLERAPHRGAAFALSNASKRARIRSIGSRSRGSLFIFRSSLFTLFFVPLAVEFLKHTAENIGLYDRPAEAAGAVMNFFLSFAERTWVRVTALGLGSFVAGLWLDWLLRKLDRSRAEARENLGLEMLNLANDINNALGLVNRFRLPDFAPRLTSAFIKAKQVGLWTPDVRMPLNGVMDYLRHR